MDVGTGDGRAVLATASRDPRTLALGIDADMASMAESSRRAARPARKGGRPNAAFVVAAAESMPVELRAMANLVTVQLPWGSLLRGCLGRDAAVAAGIAGLVAPRGALDLLLAPAPRDGLSDVPLAPAAIVGAAARAFEPAGLRLVDGRVATAEEILASGSSWARRLGATRPERGAGEPARPVVLVRLERSAGR